MTSRDRRVERLLGMLAHATADTAEGRAFAKQAARLQRGLGMTDDDVATARAARAARDRRECRLAELEGWTEPWMVDLAGAVSLCTGCVCQLLPRAKERLPVVVLTGPGAGAAADRAVALRAQVAAQVGRVGGEEAIRSLTLRQAAGPSAVQMMPGGFFSIRIEEAPRTTDLGSLFGGSAGDVYRMLCTRRLLGAELEDALRRARKERGEVEAEMRRRAQAQRAQAASGHRVEPEAAPPPAGQEGANAGQGAAPRPEASEPPPRKPEPTEEEAAAARACDDLMRRCAALMQRLDGIAATRPAWLEEVRVEVPEAALVRRPPTREVHVDG